MTETAYERITAALRGHGCKVVERSGQQASATCPAHEDRNPSLSVTGGPDRVLVKCQAGCDTDAVLSALDMSAADLFDTPKTSSGRDDWTPCGHGIAAEYRYVDEHGELLFAVVRCPRKDFVQWRPDPTAKSGRRWKLGDTRRVLYRLPRVLEAAAAGATVYVVEGEKDVHAIEAAGGIATTAPMGAKKWRPEYADTLKGAAVVVVADRDESGRVHAAQVAASLAGVAASVTVVEAATGKDAADHLAAGHGLTDFKSHEPPASEPAAVPAPAGQRQDLAADGGFWSARASLARIHQYARARRAAPWATLGVVLARVVAATPPFVVLPALVGGHGSLNLYVAIIGPSGAGKGAAERTAADAVTVGGITTASVGSGEGIAHLYARRTRQGIERHTDAVLLSVPEIDTLSALGSRQGSTLLPELRRAWSGEALGFSYADPDKRLPIGGHSYRLTLVVGVQPARAGGLLDDADGGTPQRMLWLPATDPAAPDVAPDEPAGLLWERPPWPHAEFGTSRVVLSVCQMARAAVDAARLARLRGQPGDLDGHALLAQLKTAAALALLDGRPEVTEEDWQLAGIVAVVSQRTRDQVTATLQHTERERNRRRGEAEGDRAVIAAERIAEADVKRCCANILRKLDDGEWWPGSKLRRAIAARIRPHVDEAVQLLLDTGQVEAESIDGGGVRYRRTGTGR